MGDISESSLQSISDIVGLNGTDKKFRTPFFYKILLFIIPPIIRPLTNVHFKGLERIPKKSPAIFIGNHTSHIDPFVKIMAGSRPIHYLAKEEHFENNHTRIVMESTGQIETIRAQGGGEALDRAVDVLNAGVSMGIFPEGTRSRKTEPPFLGKGKTGVARLAAKFPHTPIVPIAIIGARDFMKPKSAIIRPFSRVDVIVGPSITFAEWLENPEGGNMNEDDIKAILSLDEHGIRSMMKGLYRSFTDQVIESFSLMGAP